MANFTILEPMSIGDVIDRAVRLYRKNFVPLLSIVSVPGFIGYLASTFFWFGYAKMVLGSGPTGVISPDAFSIFMLIMGGLLYPVWLFSLLYTVSGMSRVIGDHIMLGELITFRNCFRAARQRLGDIVLMGLLCIVILFVFYFFVSIIFLLVAIVAGILVGITAGAGLPPWLMMTLTSLAAVIAILAGVAAVLMIVARVIFLPQVVMIEGQSAGQAVSRAMALGKKNWYKVGAIILFTYFVSLSLLAALTLPVLAGLYLAGILDAQFLISPTWNIMYTSFSQLSNFLTLPIWIIGYTLLYFDNRVRKEAYDLELLAREVNPGFYWQPQYQTVMGYQTPMVGSFGRHYVQTSPLGLAGWRPAQPVDNALDSQPGQDVRYTAPPSSRPDFPSSTGTQKDDQSRNLVGIENTSSVFEPPKVDSISESPGEPQPSSQVLACHQCGTVIDPSANFCIRCGKALNEMAI